jgi:hypothetical protein
MESKWFNEKENLEQLILVEKLSYEEIGRRYGCSGANIKKVARKIGIDLPKRRKINPNETFNKGCTLKPKDESYSDNVVSSNTTTVTSAVKKCINCGNILDSWQRKYCCNQCQSDYQHKQQYQKIIEGDPSIMRANYIPRNFKKDILEEQKGVCAICGMKPEWNNKPLVFILDHIDGHASNNKRSNLRCICPNCDSQLDTYKSKNKNGERSYYRYHKFNEGTVE